MLIVVGLWSIYTDTDVSYMDINFLAYVAQCGIWGAY